MLVNDALFVYCRQTILRVLPNSLLYPRWDWLRKIQTCCCTNLQSCAVFNWFDFYVFFCIAVIAKQVLGRSIILIFNAIV